VPEIPPRRLGIDLGGSKIEGAVLDPAGRVVAAERVPTPAADGHAAVVAAVAGLVARLEARVGRADCVGIGTPGSIAPDDGRLRNCNAACLNGHRISDDFAAALGRDVTVANDADCFTLSEATDGAAAGARIVFGIILGTGTGGGVVVDGRLVGGPDGITGEWGHNPLPWPTPEELPGPECSCGRRACIEAWVSGTGLAADHARDGGPRLDGREIALRAAAGDPRARASLERHHERLARALATVVNLLDPDVIVVGGGLSALDSLYARVPAGWRRHIVADPVRTRLARARHGDASGVRGAAFLAAARRSAS
jgi:predicted NBD/HSP70 family sugar kinase